MSAKDRAIAGLEAALRRQHFSKRTLKSYAHWVGEYCDALSEYPASDSSEKKVQRFLSKMAFNDYSASSQNQAFAALQYLYRHVIGKPLGDIDACRAKKPKRVIAVPSREETAALLDAVMDEGGYPSRLIARLMYGCGLRISDALRLRMKDVLVDQRRIIVRDGKGQKDREVSLPSILADPVREQMAVARAMWQRDQSAGLGVPLPGRLAVKYPASVGSVHWYWVFPAHSPCEYPRGSGRMYRWHVHESTVQRAVRAAARRVGLGGMVTPHTLRHCYATHAIEMGASVRDVQVALGHSRLDTTMIYVRADALRVPSPLDLGHCTRAFVRQARIEARR